MVIQIDQSVMSCFVLQKIEHKYHVDFRILHDLSTPNTDHKNKSFEQKQQTNAFDPYRLDQQQQIRCRGSWLETPSLLAWIYCTPFHSNQQRQSKPGHGVTQMGHNKLDAH
jgi:hypothetical protein